jgi:hypothetical protein
MILDNVEDGELVNDCFPSARHGAVLITSRRNLASLDLDIIEDGKQIKEFSGPEGAKILMKLVNRPLYSGEEATAAQRLSEELGGLALALGVMAAQVRRRQETFEDFLEFYKANKADLHKSKSGTKAYQGSLHTCWNMSFRQLSDHAFSLLAVLSFLAPDSIPERLFEARVAASLPLLSFCESEIK